MKKLLSIVLALALAFSLSVTAFAAGDEDTGDDTGTTTQGTTITQDTDKTGKTTVNYSVAPAYTVTIPASVTIDGTNNSNTVTVSAEGVKVAKGQQVVVKLTGINVTDAKPSGDNDFKVKTDEGAELKYTVKDASGNTINKDGTVLTVKAGQNNETDANGNNLNTGASAGSVALTFALAEDEVVKYAGTYTGTVTFNVSVEAVPATGGDGTVTTP